MELAPSAHVDTFCRDNLPPREQWPDFRFDLPELRYPQRLNCAAALLDDVVAEHGADRPALHSERESWSYGQLLARANQLAHYLSSDAGLLPGQRVLLRGPNSPWLVACWFAVLKAGGVVVTTVPMLRSGENTQLIELTRASLALCDHRFVEDLAPATSASGIPMLRYGGGDAEDLIGLSADKPTEFVNVDTAADDVALLAPTSGTTGDPKATMHFHRDVLAIADTFGKHLVARPAGRRLHRHPAAGLHLRTRRPAGVPAADRGLDAADRTGHPHRARRGRGAAPRHRAVHRADRLPGDPARRPAAPAGHRAARGLGRRAPAQTGLAGVARQDRHRAYRRHRQHRDAARVHLGGRRRHPAGRDRQGGARLHRGGARRRRQARARTARAGRLAVVGPTGCRYLADPRQAVYVQHGWNVTGDTYIRDSDGYFWYQARSDDMIVSSGYNIAAPEVERALEQHPDVVECAVVARPDAERGATVHAVVVLREGAAQDAAKVSELQDFTKQTIAPYKYPRSIEFAAALPRTSTGKVQRFRLRETEKPRASALARSESAVPAGKQGPAGTAPERRKERRMRIAVIGGGPGGLYFAALAKALDPDTEIRVWERNAAEDTFGFGVVFSDETLGGIEHADPVIYARMAEQFARWDDIDIHFRGTLTTVGGQGFAAMSRKTLLQLLQERCAELGVDVRFRTQAPDVDTLSQDYDLVLACDGANSAVRTKYADVFRPSLEVGRNKYMWLGTDLVFEAFKFYICQTPYGIMQVHGYPYDATGSTFIVEMHDDVWHRAGFAESASTMFAPGVSDEKSVARVQELIGDILGRPPDPEEQLQVAELQHHLQRHLAKRQRGADRRRRAHRALLDRLGHQAGDGGRARAGRLPARASRRRDRGAGLRGRTPSGGAVDPARGPGQPGLVREHRPLRRAVAGAVRVQHRHPQPPHHL